jgi:RNA polymerase sigma factor (sigma-70 family)
MLAAVPSLRAFAISLCGNVDRADDLVQEALLRAWANLDSFEPGTNMSAWLFTILRNLFRSEYRKRRREVEDADGSYAESLTSLPDQNSCPPTSANPSSWSVPLGSPMRKPRKSAAALSAPSKAGSTVPAADWRRSSRSSAPIISVPIMKPVRWWDKPPVPGDGRRRHGTLTQQRRSNQPHDRLFGQRAAPFTLRHKYAAKCPPYDAPGDQLAGDTTRV